MMTLTSRLEAARRRSQEREAKRSGLKQLSRHLDG